MSSASEIRLRRGWRALARRARTALGRLLNGREFPRRYFDRIYRDPDPWDYLTSSYELAKHERTLSVLPRARYARVLDLGCSIGALTERLAWRADHVDAVDFSTPAVARASGHCRHHRHLRFHVSDLLRFRAAAPYDLVLCSEVLYYLWNPERLRREVRSRLGQLVAPGGDLLVVWGGIRLPQDWRAVLTHGGRLQAMHDEIVEDPVRPYRLLLLRGAPSVHGGES